MHLSYERSSIMDERNGVHNVEIKKRKEKKSAANYVSLLCLVPKLRHHFHIDNTLRLWLQLVDFFVHGGL